METSYCLTTLPNGARIATATMPHMRSVAVGFWAAVGGRHEQAGENGASHFLEHLLFKGTKRRTAKQLSEAVEGVGGYVNAFTTEDHTCYYAKAGVEHFARVADVLGDMYCASTLAAAEIEREREVIREEILMYRDQPADHARELLSEAMWPGHPLGRPLTGTVESVASLRRGALRGYWKRNYTGATTIVTVAGPLAHAEAVATLAPLLRRLPRGHRPRYARARLPREAARVALHTQETEQTQLAMGFHAFGRRDERRFALKLLSVILGENMSSRLFQKLRERHGYCYSIASSMVTLADAGAVHIHAGIDHEKLRPALKMILGELAAICRRAPSKHELKKAQDYTIGQTFMGLEATSSQGMWMGESLLGYGRILAPGDIETKLCAVTPEQVQAVACHCLHRGRLGLAVVGPMRDRERIEGWLG